MNANILTQKSHLRLSQAPHFNPKIYLCIQSAIRKGEGRLVPQTYYQWPNCNINSNPLLPPPPESDVPPPPSTAPAKIQPPQKSEPPRFDPSRMIGIVRRKALIKDLAAAYHSECLAYRQELLELQRKCEEPYIDVKTTEDTRKETMRPPKRLKKTR